MAQGIALLTGVKDMSPGGLGCEHDVDKMAKVISSVGECTINILKTELATASAILKCIESAADTLASGDLFVFYFSGHGGQKPAVDGEEDDGQDETLCTYASEIVDDDLAKICRRRAHRDAERLLSFRNEPELYRYERHSRGSIRAIRAKCKKSCQVCREIIRGNTRNEGPTNPYRRQPG